MQITPDIFIQRSKPFTVVELPDQAGRRLFTKETPAAFLVQRVSNLSLGESHLEVLEPRDFISTPLPETNFVEVSSNPTILTEIGYANLLKQIFKSKNPKVRWWHATLADLYARQFKNQTSETKSAAQAKLE